MGLIANYNDQIVIFAIPLVILLFIFGVTLLGFMAFNMTNKAKLLILAVALILFSYFMPYFIAISVELIKALMSKAIYIGHQNEIANEAVYTSYFFSLVIVLSYSFYIFKISPNKKLNPDSGASAPPPVS